MSYPGGKNGAGVYQQIINHIPPHKLYIEPFLGGGAIMRLKRPAEASIAIDIDYAVMQTFDRGATPNLTMLIADALKWMQGRSFPSDTFIYLDPPYLFETRSTRRKIYAHELTDKQHMTLLSIIKSIHCMVMISGYPNDLYSDALSRWWTHDFMTSNRGGGHVTERLWMNYPPPTRLHDYRYLGSTFREREKINRQKARWVMRLSKMNPARRRAVLEAILEIEMPGQHRPEDHEAPACLAENCAYSSVPHRQKERTAPDPIDKKSGKRSTQPVVVDAAPGGLQDHNILWSRDHGDNHGGIQSTKASRRKP